jgi:hypothetical protein
MELHLKIIGWILILLAIVHVVFPKRFNWTEELSSLSLINRQVMYVHTFFIALVVLLMGILCLTSAKELIETDLGKKIVLGLGVFGCLDCLFSFLGIHQCFGKARHLKQQYILYFHFFGHI